MEDPKPTNNKTCSCRQKSDCSLNQICLSEYLVHNAVVNTSKTKNYYGTCEKSFKERYNNHKSSFRNKSHQKRTELSNYIWELKENDENYTTDWLIAMKSHPYICDTRKCDLCLCEKLLIARAIFMMTLKFLLIVLMKRFSEKIWGFFNIIFFLMNIKNGEQY